MVPACKGQLHLCLFLISGPWLHSIPVPLVPQLNEMQLFEQSLLNLFV